MFEWLVAWWNRPSARERVLTAMEKITTPEKAEPGWVIRKRARVANGTVYTILTRLREEGLVACRYEYLPATQGTVAYWWRTPRGGRDPVEVPPGMLVPA